jgi:hypothetical protein
MNNGQAPPAAPAGPPVAPISSEELEARQREALEVKENDRSFIDEVIQSISGANANADSTVTHSISRSSNSSSSSFASLSALMPENSGASGTDPIAAMRLALSSASRSRRPFRTAKELEDALMDAAKKSAQTHPADTARMSHLFAYANFVSGLAREDLDAAQAYHFFVAKEEQEGRHVICTPGGHFHAEAYSRHFLRPKATSVSSSTSSSRDRPHKRRRKTTSPPGGRSTTAYPPGSCKNHPHSTTHSTDECRNKRTRQD